MTSQIPERAMHTSQPSGMTDTTPDALFGLDEIPTSSPVRRTAGPTFRDSPKARRMLSFARIDAEDAAASSPRGSGNVRYRNAPKGAAVETVRRLVGTHAPWLRIRYAF
ncbi:hypothetical protein ACIQ7Q_10900 [Streptomyces sp. NPDC096176]|uniref:hypothetical protein n=1 Tax=Streptomyces sp. NPDC096176 TaxID=3366079 RepID=UPI00382D88B5